LEKLGKVTTFAKDTTTKALEHPLTRPLLPLIPERVRSVFLSSEEAAELMRDYVSAEHFYRQYAADLQAQMGLRERPEVIESDTAYEFENIRGGYKSHFVGLPLTRELWDSWHVDGKLTVSPIHVACTIFCGGVEPDLRKTVWPYILKYKDWAVSEEMNVKQNQLKNEKYRHMKSSWIEVLADCAVQTPIAPSTPHKGAVGDENENSDVVSKLLERKYRIGVIFLMQIKMLLEQIKICHSFTWNPLEILNNSVRQSTKNLNLLCYEMF
jgi:hypothetical protein